jgi:hypothetical protein
MPASACRPASVIVSRSRLSVRLPASRSPGSRHDPGKQPDRRRAFRGLRAALLAHRHVKLGQELPSVASLASTGAFLGRQLQEFRWLDLQNGRQLSNDLKADPGRTLLNLAHVSTVHIRLMGQILLR